MSQRATPVGPQGSLKVRLRAKKPKTRTGCQTCKLRKVKCDERRPGCKKCELAGRECSGYKITISQTDENRHTLVIPRSALVSQPQTLPNLSVPEARSFDFFRNVTVRQMPGCFRFDYLAQTILSVGYCEPSLLHAAIAVGSVHQSFDKPSLFPNRSPMDLNTQFALRQYNKAIGHLKVCLSRKIDSSTRELVLMNCLMFACLDILRGQRASALTHVANGLRISCEDLPEGQEKPSTYSKNNPGSVTANLAANLARMAIQGAFYGEISPAYALLGQRSMRCLRSKLSTTFSTLLEARQELDIISGPIFRLRWQFMMSKFMGSKRMIEKRPMQTAFERSLFEDLTSSQDIPLDKQYHELRIRLSTWSMALDAFIALSRASFSNEDLMATKTLRAHCVVLFLMLSTWQSVEEMVWDQYESQFELINSLVREYLAIVPTLKHSDSFSGLPNFIIDMGIMSVLYFTILKCRNPSIRRESLSLVRQVSCQEGMLNNQVYAAVAAKVIAIEEGAAIREIPLTHAKDIPGSARFVGVILFLSENEQDMKLRFGRFEHEKDGEWCEMEEDLKYV